MIDSLRLSPGTMKSDQNEKDAFFAFYSGNRDPAALLFEV